MLARRQRRRLNIEPTLGQCLVFARIANLYILKYYVINQHSEDVIRVLGTIIRLYTRGRGP